MSTEKNTFTVTLDNPLTVLNPKGEKALTIEARSAEGGDGGAYLSLFIHNGDLMGLRNIQGGNIDTGQADDINLDIGAGDSVNRGWVSLQPDVGKGTILGSGRNRPVAKFAGNDDPAKDRTDIYSRTYLHHTLWVPDGHGGFRKAQV